MTNVNKRNLIVVAVVLSVALIAAICVSVFFPKKTIADLLHLTAKDQIKQIKISSMHIANAHYGSTDKKTVYDKQLDITDTPLGKQYIDVIFSKPVTLLDGAGKCPALVVQGTDYKTVTVKLTIDCGEDAPLVQKEIPIECCAFPELCDIPEVYVSYDYTTEYISKRFKENLARNIQENLNQNQSYVFLVPDEELFTAAFINEQLGVSE